MSYIRFLSNLGALVERQLFSLDSFIEHHHHRELDTDNGLK